MELWLHSVDAIANSMNAWLGPVSVGLQTSSELLVAGVPFFRLLSSSFSPEAYARISRQSLAIMIISLMIFGLAQLGQLIVQLAALGDLNGSQPLLHLADGLLYLRETRPGHVWLLKTSISLTILLVISGWFLRTRCAPVGTYSQWLVLTLVGALLVASSALSGHYAGQSAGWIYVTLHMVHLVAVAFWAGSLPSWWITVRSISSEKAIGEQLTELLRRYSSAATLLVIVAICTGIPLAWLYIDNQGDMLGTRWGLMLVMKISIIGLVLMAAYSVRRRLNTETLSRRWALYAVGIETGLLSIVVVLASQLAQTVPAAHDQPFWWLPFRLSYDAIAPDKSLLRILWSAVAVALAAIVLAAFSYRRATNSIKAAGWIFAALVAAALAVWAATIPAYPDTFRRSEVPYLSESIASGLNIYNDNCVPCHGKGGRADGPLAPFTRRPPVDLAAPHTALHTAGDLFGWIGNGMPSGAMPGFSTSLSEQDRWDLVNFLRVFSQGFQARVLDAHVVPEQPWLGAPDFYLANEDGRLSQLKALRGNPVLILAQDDCTSELGDRVESLTHWKRNYATQVEIVVVCVARGHGIPQKEIWMAQSPGAVISAYSLLSRTLSNKGERGVMGVKWHRSEYLVDRYGYIRARWIPEEDPVGWTSTSVMETELNVLSRDKGIPPNPDSHVH